MSIDLKADEGIEFLIGQKLKLDGDAGSIIIDVAEAGNEGHRPELWRVRYFDNKDKENKEIFTINYVNFIINDKFNLVISNDTRHVYSIRCSRE